MRSGEGGMESEEGEAVNTLGGERLGLFKPRWGKEDFALHSRQRRGRVFSSKLWEAASPSPALPLSSLAGHGQAPLPPAHLVPGAQTPFFCPSHLHQGRGCSCTRHGEVGLVWERTCSALQRSVERSAVIYAPQQRCSKTSYFYGMASSLFPPHVPSCLSGL